MEKKWREIGGTFNFGPTTTSASFVLKKHYNNLLYTYEKIYFFNSKLDYVPFTPQVSVTDVTDHEDSPEDEDPDPVSVCATGTITAKFDCGYLVSVKMGNQLLYGVLYHPDGPPASSNSAVAAADGISSMAIVPYTRRTPPSSVRRRRVKRKRWGGDPSHPKPNRSGYNFFFAEKHLELKRQFPDREREFTKMIGVAWNGLGPAERSVYQEMGVRDKERYKRELKEYNERSGAVRSKMN